MSRNTYDSSIKERKGIGRFGKELIDVKERILGDL
jgi:hypothetical protein